MYSLQILFGLMKESDAPGAISGGGREWVRRFISSGGVEHLHNILLTIDVPSYFKNQLTTTCVALLLRLYNQLGSVAKDTAEGCGFTIDYSALIERLLLIMREIAAAAATAAAIAPALN